MTESNTSTAPEDYNPMPEGSTRLYYDSDDDEGREQYEFELHLAKSSNIDLLCILATDTWRPPIRLAVAGNSYTPLPWIRVLAWDIDAEVRLQAAKVLITRLLVRRAMHSATAGVNFQGTLTPSYEGRTLVDLSQEEEAIQWDEAENPSTPVSVLIEMSKRGDLLIWQCLLQNPSTPTEVVEAWCEVPDSFDDHPQFHINTKLAEYRLENAHAIANAYKEIRPATYDI